MPFIHANALTTFYRLDGAGEAPVLMLAHPLGTHSEIWAAQVDALAHRYRLLRYDLRGHGQTEVPDGPYDVANLAADAAGLIDALGIERVSFVGASLGSLVGLALAQTRPERVERLVLLGARTRFGPAHALEQRAATVAEGGVAAVVQATLERWLTPAFHARQPEVVESIRDMLLAAPKIGYLGALAAVRDADFSAAPLSVAAPTLVMTGREDGTAPPEAAKALAAAIPGAEFAVLAGAHLANVEDPETFNARVLAFGE